jgi:hypothetical protein
MHHGQDPLGWKRITADVRGGSEHVEAMASVPYSTRETQLK